MSIAAGDVAAEPDTGRVERGFHASDSSTNTTAEVEA